MGGPAGVVKIPYVTSVAELLMQDMRLTTIAQARLDPWIVEGWCTIGPMPLAFTIHHTKNIKAAMGVTIIFTTKKWRLSERAFISEGPSVA